MSLLLMALLWGPAGAQTDARPTAAVLALQARNGVVTDAAALVTDNVVDELRRMPAFRRVTSWPELQALLSLEQAKQLADCGGESCVAEVMGALNVDYVILGSVGRMGRHMLLNLQMMQVRTSSLAASMSVRVCAHDEGLILGVIKPAIYNMLIEGRLMRGTVRPLPTRFTDCPEVPAKAAGPSPATSPPAAAVSGEDGSFRRRAKVLGGLGAAGLAGVGALVGLGGLIGAASSAVYLVRLLTSAAFLSQLPTPGLEQTQRLLFLYGFGAVGGLGGLVLVAGGLVTVAVSTTALVLLFLFGS